VDPLLGQASTVWTNKEVLYAFGSAAAVLTPAVLTLYRFLSAGLRHRLAASSREVHDLKKRLEEMVGPATEEMKRLLDDAKEQLHRLSEEMAEKDKEHQRQSEKKNELIETHRCAAEKLESDLDAINSQFNSLQRKIDRAVSSDGYTWIEKVRYNAPDFHPLDERRMPIVSVLNLKGGVGKTTLTANLGAALSRRGWKVLMIDLDLQGSLTSLFLQAQEQEVMAQRGALIGDFLSRSFDAEFPNLLSYTAPILGSEQSSLVGTVDALAYAETSLTVRWLLRAGNRDPRFILRRELHLKRISNRFDIVLLDCPPLINVSCVNALAASDYVLIPVMPSKATTDRVPALLWRMLQFRENINPHLKPLGLVANRTWGPELTSDEKNRLSELVVKARNVWGEDIHLLKTSIRQSTDLRTAEDEHRPLSESEKMAESFSLLAAEIETRLPTFCQATATPTVNRIQVMQ
jgi:cellulose biosynthesis protein BcsQ